MGWMIFELIERMILILALYHGHSCHGYWQLRAANCFTNEMRSSSRTGVGQTQGRWKCQCLSVAGNQLDRDINSEHIKNGNRAEVRG